MLGWVEASLSVLERGTLAALREHVADNGGSLPPFRLPALARRIVGELARFLAAGSDGEATGLGEELAAQGLGLRSWLAVGRALARDFAAGAGEQAGSVDAAAVLARQQLFVTYVVEGLVRRELTAVSRQRDEMHAALERVIDAREGELRQVIQQLSTPVMPVHRKILVLPLIGGVDDERARRITERLLAETGRRQARIVIIDVTGLTGYDAGVLAAIGGAMRAVQLLGARAVLAGIGPELAGALVELDVELAGFVALADLQGAIEWALRELGLAILPRPLAAGGRDTHRGSRRHGD